MKTRIAELKLSLRQQEILGMARQKGYLSTEELARTLQVTTQTIRRDINLLCESGVMRRYHGGVGLALSTENVDYLSRQVLNQEAKTRIARMVAGQIPDSASLFINIGTTTEPSPRRWSAGTGICASLPPERGGNARRERQLRGDRRRGRGAA